MYLFLKRLFYGCSHEYKFIGCYWKGDGYGGAYRVSVYRCSNCLKVKKDKFK